MCALVSECRVSACASVRDSTLFVSPLFISLYLTNVLLSVRLVLLLHCDEPKKTESYNMMIRNGKDSKWLPTGYES